MDKKVANMSVSFDGLRRNLTNAWNAAIKGDGWFIKGIGVEDFSE